ncbi:MAG: hypothetical protein FWD36_07300 [Treponema sp.]|nr:hypothetical protein [Treponema sp.]
MKSIAKVSGIILVAIIFGFTFVACPDPVEDTLALPVITIVTQPAATTNVTAGSISNSLSVVASVTQSQTLSYRWFSNTSNSNVGGTFISGATGASYTIPTDLTAGTYFYFCEVRATGGAASVRSNVATVNASALPTITITAQPAPMTNVTVGSISGSLSVSASVTQSQTLSYQWYSNTSNSNVGGTEIAGATGASYPIPTNLTAGTYFYFCEVRATGGAASVRSNAATVSVPHEIGATGPGGGIIFYYDPTGFTMTDTGETCHYLEAAPVDMATMRAWASSGFTATNIPGTETAIGTGRRNTALILATDPGAPAARACRNYSHNGKSDWFLPSSDELNQLYLNRSAVGNMLGIGWFWWSSSQVSPYYNSAWGQNFGEGGYLYIGAKLNDNNVRPVRAF